MMEQEMPEESVGINPSDWYGEGGRILAGYEQIMARQRFLRVNAQNMTKQQIDYEFSVINGLINSIPLDLTRREYRKSALNLLGKIREDLR